MTNIEISVIIPCYNDGTYIHETIESLNQQTYKDFEIIIIDDASTDKTTKETLANLKQNNLQVLFLEKNSGPGIARNTGIEIARGKYILPLDADDKIAPTYLEKAKKILETEENTGIVYCQAEFFGKISKKWELPKYEFPEILVSNMIFATAMYRKSDWKTVGGYNGNMIYGYEDYDFWLSLLELGRNVYQIDEILFYYRIKEDSRSTKLAEETKLLDTF
ncbi:MAG: glycosyltransferase family 2 protein, partial [Flavobacteriaceae bacterium]|nr:glycosyltransferase family 2 protein [Flavobacteriaceae bacterium]